jgi:bifunctional non-homologous end joining protein LigD
VRRGGRSHIFVVQKHAASRLHYDFRLEIKGVLASWAVPKGPSMNPADKRLAVRTEDHPVEYADFEGVIPEGQYGAGPVMVWDKGTYEARDSVPAEKQLARGKIDVALYGNKLRGGFALLQTGNRSGGLSDRKRWLLIKHRDEHSDPSWDIDRPEFDRSVLTGRTLKEIARPSGKKALTRRTHYDHRLQPLENFPASLGEDQYRQERCEATARPHRAEFE